MNEHALNEPRRYSSLKICAALVALASLWWRGSVAPASPAPATNAPFHHSAFTPSPSRTSFISSPLSLADAVNLALRQNPAILRAQKDLEASQGVVIQTRAVALPRLTGTAGSNA